jgi:hypothetical protein
MGLIASFLLLCSVPGSAARIEVMTSSTSIAPGDALSVSVLGDSEGETAFTAAVLLVYSGNAVPADATGPFELESSTPDAIWETTGRTGACGLETFPPDSCLALEAFTDPGIRGNLLLGTFTIFEFDTSTAAPGSLLTFQAIPAGIGFFGAGPSEVVTVQVIPEPTPGLLVALGLLALAGGAKAGELFRRGAGSPGP